MNVNSNFILKLLLHDSDTLDIKKYDEKLLNYKIIKNEIINNENEQKKEEIFEKEFLNNKTEYNI
jgi:hypothetical protein